jgi:hypothetical protein
MSFTRKDELGTTEPSIAGLRKKFRTNNANAEDRNDARNDARNDDAGNDDDRTADLLAAWLGIVCSRVLANTDAEFLS